MNKFKNIALKSFLWDFSGRLLRQGIIFLLSIFLTRLLTPADFGLIAMITAFISISSTFMSMGLVAALVQRKEVSDIHYNSIFVFNVVLGVVLTLAFFLNAELVAQYYNEPQLLNVVRVTSLNFLVNALGTVQIAKLKRAMNFAFRTKAELFAALLSGSVAVFFAYYGYGVWSLVIQSLLYNLIFVFLLWIFSRWKPDFSFSWLVLKDLWQFGLNIFYVNLLNRLSESVDVLTLGKFYGSVELGLYNRAKALNLLVVRFASDSLGSVLFPLLSSIQDDKIKYRNITTDALAFVSFITFGLLGLLYLIAEPLIIFLYTEKWQAAIPIFKILVLSGYSFPIINIVSEVLKGKGKSKELLQTGIATKFIFVLGVIMGIYFGFSSFLYALAFIAFINSIVYLFVCASTIGIEVITLIKNTFVYLILALISVFSIVFLLNSFRFRNFDEILILSCTFVAFYGLSNFVLKTRGLKLVMRKLKQLLF